MRNSEPDLERPSPARIYDYLLRGPSEMNLEIDRRFADQILAKFPLVRQLAKVNRWWMNQVARRAAAGGIRQFLDLGSGLPAANAVHEVISGRVGRARVVYVDNEAIAAAWLELAATEAVGDDLRIVALQEDLRDPDAILYNPAVRAEIDFDEPICILFASVLHFVPNSEDIPALLDRYISAAAPGSWLALSHGTDENLDADAVARIRAVVEFYKQSQNPVQLRNRDEIASWMSPLRLLPPGIDRVPAWQTEGADDLAPELSQAGQMMWCAVGEQHV